MKCVWDIESIGTLARRMSQEKERVNRQIEQLQSCKSSLSSAVSGDAGMAMQEALQNDLIRMQELSRMIDVQIQKLRAVGNKCYELCEETLIGKINEAEANIK